MFDAVVKALGSDAGKLVRRGNKGEERMSVGCGNEMIGNQISWRVENEANDE